MSESGEPQGQSPYSADSRRLIAFAFTVFDEQGGSLGGNVGERPRIFEVGANEVLPAIEKALVGLQEGESCSVVLAPEDAYGPVRQEAFLEFPLDSIPEAARKVGRKVMAQAPDGAEDMFDVVAIQGDCVTLDTNHPLAGQTLRFELEVLHSEPG